jgi:hypothetical protein
MLKETQIKSAKWTDRVKPSTSEARASECWVGVGPWSESANADDSRLDSVSFICRPFHGLVYFLQFIPSVSPSLTLRLHAGLYSDRLLRRLDCWFHSSFLLLQQKFLAKRNWSNPIL